MDPALLDRARQLGSELAKAVEALNASIRKTEEALQGHFPEKSASVEMRRDGEGWVQSLLYWEGKLYLESGYWWGGRKQRTPLLSASKEVRCLAASHLYGLLAQLRAC